MYQNDRENFANKGKWYARIKPVSTKGLKEIAEIIQRNASVKRSDVMAVLTELPEVMNDMLREGHRVKIEGLGAFKIGISSLPADTEKDFNVKQHIKNSRIIFQPETVRVGSQGTRTRLLAGELEFKDVAEMQKKQDKNP